MRPHKSLLVALLLAWSAIGLPPSHAQRPWRPAPLSADLLQRLEKPAGSNVRVIVHGDHTWVASLATRYGGTVKRWLQDGASIELPDGALGALRNEPGIDHLSGDLPVVSSMKVTNKSTAADQTRAGSSGLLGLGLLGSSSSLDGRGIGIAVVDSGIASHSALGSRIVSAVSFTGATTDQFGHGTHVAGTAAGASTSVTYLYDRGIAPGAKLISVRVLGANGVGYTSDVIAGIDWVVEHKAQYNIRVMNLSIGKAVTEPAATDPLCEAVERAVNAGIVVVASAGNYGKLPDGTPVLGGITSPGNSPHAITVGALNTWGTADPRDDTVASYSSRGPTRYDFAIKPDLVAPGDRVVATEAAGSYLATRSLGYHVAGYGTNAYLRLSGSSMATAVVSGGVALLLQANPSLTPRQVKLALQSSATFMPRAGLVAAGAGSVNFLAARDTVTNGLLGTLTTTVAGVLGTSGGAFYWDSGSLNERVFSGAGIRLLSALDLPLIFGDPTRAEWGDLNLVGLLNPIRSLGYKQTVWGDAGDCTASEYFVWGTEILDCSSGQYFVWGNHDPNGQYFVWGNSNPEDDSSRPRGRGAPDSMR